jgi:hypothetical protein
MRPAPKVVSSPLRREPLDEHGVEALDLLYVREVRGIVEEDDLSRLALVNISGLSKITALFGPTLPTPNFPALNVSPFLPVSLPSRAAWAAYIAT